MSDPTYKKWNPIKAYEGLVMSVDSPQALDAHLTTFGRLPQHVAIRQFIIYHQVQIGEVIEKQANKFKVFERVNPGFPAYRIVKIRPDGMKYEGVIAVLPGSRSHISRIVTVSKSGFWEQVVRRLVRKHFYPKAMPVYFKQQELADALSALEATLPKGQTIHLADVISREAPTADHAVRVKDYDTYRIWTDKPWREVFRQASENNLWFTGLKLRIQRIETKVHRPAIATGRILKQGEMHFDFYYEYVASSALPLLEARAGERLDLLQNRGLRERQYRPAEPIQILFEHDVFGTVEKVREFGKIVGKYPNSSKAVYHANPYYHASVADYLDGSSFDVWVLSRDRMLLMPQAKSSPQAFERLISYLFTEFHEGRVGAYKAASRSD